MCIEFELAVALFHAMGSMALVSIAFGSIERLEIRPAVRKAILGAAFGAASVGAMFNQVHVGDGLVADGRAIIVGFAGAFGGLIVGAIAASLAAAYRGLQGGSGALAGVLGIYAAAGLGYLWSILVQPSRRMNVLYLCCLGLLVSAHILTVFILPVGVAWPIFLTMWPHVTVTAVMSAFIMGFFLVRETGLIEQERMLRRTASTDPLTGLPNRRSFDRALSRSLKEAAGPSRTSFAVLMMDIDHFKRVNDTYGHAAGDAVLQSVGQALQRTVRHHDTVARLGGEEFGVILSDGDKCRADLVARRLREAVEELLTSFEGQSMAVTVSAGLAHFQPGDSATDLLARADQALYRAKADGRDRVVIAKQSSARA